MTQINLRVYRHIARAEAFVSIQRKNGNFETFVGIVDTGAEVSLLPNYIKEIANYETLSQVTIERAGISKQTFKVEEALVNLFLQDPQGNMTTVRKVTVWFAETQTLLLGMRDLLASATLHLNMPELHGYIDLP